MTGSQQTNGGSGLEVSRRRYMAGAAAVAGTALAGCSDILGGGGGGPEGTVRNFVSAAANGNIENANSMIHPDGPAPEMTQAQSDSLQQLNVQVDSTEVVEEGEEMALVDVTLTTSVAGTSESMTQQWELRRHDGEWKIWQLGI